MCESVKQVTAAVIIEEGRILLARRPPGDPLAGLWELPGGKIEPGETPQQCLERELLEELDLSATAGEVLATTVYEYDHGCFELLAIDVVRHGEPLASFHDRLDWVSLVDLPNYALAPADVPLIHSVLGGP